MKQIPEKEKYWYQLFDSYCKKENQNWAYSWEIQIDLEIENGEEVVKTKTLTAHLNNLAEIGVLRKLDRGHLTAFCYAGLKNNELTVIP